jgi:sulfite oxidase
MGSMVVEAMRTSLNPPPGVYEIWSRAIDALGRTQPLDGSIFWNPNGYEWTGVFKSEVTVE